MAKRKGQGIVERRYAPLSDVEVRGDNGGISFTGHAAVFNSLTDLFFFREQVAPGAFTRTIKNGTDVRFLFNHEPDSVMARTTNGTLRLSEDRKGLVAEADLDAKDWDTQRLVPKMERGDVSQMSFAFEVLKDEWDEEPEDGGIPIRTLREVKLFDVSPVTFPAYEATDATLSAVRSMLEKSEHRELLDQEDSTPTSTPSDGTEEPEGSDEGTTTPEESEEDATPSTEDSPSAEEAPTEDATEDVAGAQEDEDALARKREKLARLKAASRSFIDGDLAEYERRLESLE